MKRKLTAEQEAARDARRLRFRELVKQVAAMDDDARATLAAKVSGIVTVEGHGLSLHNTLLVILQNPPATIVGGFRQWIKHGRAVRKGEHGCMIWVPVGRPKGDRAELATVQPIEDANGERDSTRFMMGTVFDVSQTQEIETAGAAEPSGELVAA